MGNSANMNNAITMFDIPTSDFERALKFYSVILGSPLRTDDYLGQKPAYFPMEPKGAVFGELVPAGKFNKPSKVGTRVYLSVQIIDDVLSKVEKAGGARSYRQDIPSVSQVLPPLSRIPKAMWSVEMAERGR
jgi:predicted enzyme related to lactoylglutathione lyase